MTSIDVPLALPDIDDEDISLLTEAFRSGWLAHGPWNHKFEEAFAEYLGVPHAVSMNSCTSALEVALKINGVSGEVIVPSLTWCASANSVITSGGTPVFCEVDPATRNVNASTIAPHINSRTEAVMVVHFAGQPAPMDEITELCQKHDLLLIEDSAETLGATWNGRQAGSFSHGCFSFFPTKNMTTAEGGMLALDSAALADKARAMIGHGVSSTTFAREKKERPWLRAAIFPGHNYRMPNPLAALGYSQLKKLDRMNEKRQKIAGRYGEAFAKLGESVKAPVVLDQATHSYQMYTVSVDESLRNQFVMGLRERGVGASVHFDPPVHLQPAYLERGWREGQLPVTEKLVQQLVTLPIFPTMTSQQVDWVIECVGGFFNERGA